MTPSLDHRGAARILDIAESRGSRSAALVGFAVILLLAAHAAARGGFPSSAQAAAMYSAGAYPALAAQAGESPEMKRLMAIGAAAAMTAGAGAQDAVQWRVEDGGNGHWYATTDASVVWGEARARCETMGGHLATLTSLQENQFAAALAGNGTVWVGAFQPPNSCEPGCDWRWVTGEPWSFEAWAPPGANDFGGIEDVAETYASGGWNDMPDSGWLRKGLIEWSADCNADGIVDFGQFRAGELADANANNIPDCCEVGTACDCPGDTNRDGAIDGIDLATVLTRWGQSAAKFPDADCNRDGVIDGSDLAIVLGSWGACP